MTQMIDVWNMFSLEEKHAMCVALRERSNEKKRISTSVGGLALLNFLTVKEAVGDTKHDAKLDFTDKRDCWSLWFKIKKVGMLLDSQ
jgi:hypothetical protein